MCDSERLQDSRARAKAVAGAGRSQRSRDVRAVGAELGAPRPPRAPRFFQALPLPPGIRRGSRTCGLRISAPPSQGSREGPA